MERRSFHTPGMSCAHCVSTIERELKELPGVRAVAADLAGKRVTVEWEPPATWEKIKDLLAEIGYPVLG
ncbi:MAG: heavy-metal-associated domain-containing protein [Candidatus Eisenbacteria bacterium]|nr:heavy-metal-associated domain-containing protein [Candidatus Eisenbacteria bacterium]